MINHSMRTLVVIFLFIFLFPAESLPGISNRSDAIPDSIVSVSSGYVLVVDKQYQKLYVFKKNGSFSKIFEAPCSTGKNQGSKQLEGDAKTPNGVFFVTRILRNPGPPETFGTLAFPLDYPSLIDKRAGRNGNNIWIHGTTKPLAPLQSNGCVVLRDIDLQKLVDLIYFNKTPVIIQESINWIAPNQIPSSKDDLERIMEAWNKAYIDGDIKTFDSLYLPGAEIKGKKRDELLNKLKAIKSINKHFLFQPRDISILRQENTAIIMFDQIAAVENDNSFHGSYNKLVLERINNKWYIVDDTSAPTPAAISDTNISSSTIKREDTKNSFNDEVIALVNKWAGSWKSGDTKIYRNCYAANFKSKNMVLDGWIAHKNNVRKNSKNINIRIENLRVTADANNATVSFTQYYSSSILKSKSQKKLELKKIAGEWKILREIS
jgi:murein L,D-transpeptidase YafK